MSERLSDSSYGRRDEQIFASPRFGQRFPKYFKSFTTAERSVKLRGALGTCDESPQRARRHVRDRGRRRPRAPHPDPVRAPANHRARVRAPATHSRHGDGARPRKSLLGDVSSDGPGRRRGGGARHPTRSSRDARRGDERRRRVERGARGGERGAERSARAAPAASLARLPGRGSEPRRRRPRERRFAGIRRQGRRRRRDETHRRRRERTRPASSPARPRVPLRLVRRPPSPGGCGGCTSARAARGSRFPRAGARTCRGRPCSSERRRRRFRSSPWRASRP